MIYELQYTSAPRGLLPGSSGYSTVKATAGMPPPLRTILESLSVYRRVFPPGHSQAGLSPVAWSHTRVNVGGRAWQVLSRTCDAGFDHTHRSNYFVHHLAVSADSLPPAGPAWLLSQSGLLATAWDGTVGEPASAVRLPSGNDPARVCGRWKELTGDAGWAGAVASHLARRTGPVVVAFTLGTDLLSLFAQALALLPGSSRWDITFTTYFQGVSGTEPYRLRGVLSGSPEHKEATRLPQALVIDLGSPLGEPPPDELVEVARTGRRASPAVSVTFESVPDDQPDEGGTSYGLQSRAKNTAEEPAFARRPPPLTSHLPMPAPMSGGSIPWPVSFGGGLVSGIVVTVCIALALRLTGPPEATNTPIAKALPPAKADQTNDGAQNDKVLKEPGEKEKQLRKESLTEKPPALPNQLMGEKPKGKDDGASQQQEAEKSEPTVPRKEFENVRSENVRLAEKLAEQKRLNDQNHREVRIRRDSAATRAEQQQVLANLVEVNNYVDPPKTTAKFSLEKAAWLDDDTGTVELLGCPDNYHWGQLDPQNGKSWALYGPDKKEKLLALTTADTKPFPKSWNLLATGNADELMQLRRTVLKFQPTKGNPWQIALRADPEKKEPPSGHPLELSLEQPNCQCPLNIWLGKEKQLLPSDDVLLSDLHIEALSRGHYRHETAFRTPNVEVVWQLLPKGELQFELRVPNAADPADQSTVYRIRGFRVSLIVKDIRVDVFKYRDNTDPKNSKLTGSKTNE